MVDPDASADPLDVVRQEQPLQARTPVDAIDLQYAPAGQDELKRVLGPVDAASVVIGAIVGVGIFFTPSTVARIAGSADAALLAWTVGGVIAMLGALTFASLGAAYHGPGAQYDILRDAYGPAPAFLFVFCNSTAIQAGAIAIIAIICAENLGVAVGSAVPSTGWLLGIATALIISLVAANLVGVRWGAGIQNLTVYAKLATLAAIALVAAFSSQPAAATGPPPSPSAAHAMPGVSVLFAAVVPCFFAYGGWQHALWISGEVRQPRRNLPIAIIAGVLIVVAAYLAVNWAYLRLLGYDAVVTSRALAADAVATLWPQYGRRAVAAAVAFSAFGVLNAQLLSGPRLVYRMAADGRFFSTFARVHPRFRTPMTAVMLLGGVSLVLMFFAGKDGVDKLLTGVVFIDGVFFALTGLALLLLRARGGGGAIPPTLGYPVVPILFVLGELGVVLGAYSEPSTREAAYIGTLWIVAGLVLYLVRFRRRSCSAT